MSSEVEISETPNWLNELEAKREKRLKARLGHETGAGAHCLKCGEKCPGLDLHFWRKCCKICKCSKEDHEVQDDDLYGWAQFQLLGSKPNKSRRKILLPGDSNELELEWAPRGNKETIDKYLETLSHDQLHIKGSQAAQDRKQMLQKQIPIHDIDPDLCHELTENELNQMNEYIAHVKKNIVGIGQVVNLSNIIRENLHILNPNDAALIASRYPKEVPLSEIVKLQLQNMASALPQTLPDVVQKLNINNQELPNFNSINTATKYQDSKNPLLSTKIRDKSYTLNAINVEKSPVHSMFSHQLKSDHNQVPSNQNPIMKPDINEKYLRNPNFDPKKMPSQFISEFRNNAFIPYIKTSNNLMPEEQCFQENHNIAHNSVGNVSREQKSDLSESKYPSDQVNSGNKDEEDIFLNDSQNVLDYNRFHLPNYGSDTPYLPHIDNQYPRRDLSNIEQFVFSTHDPNNIDPEDMSNFNHIPLTAEYAKVLSDSRSNMFPAKKLSEFQPSKISVNEDFLHPSHVSIGPIQDINYPGIKPATQETNDFYEDYSPDSLREILNNIKLPDCHYCKEPFEEKAFAITVERANALFHSECFRCAGCNQILADNVYFYSKETDNIYCGRDYAKIRGFPRCRACDELIFTKEYCLAENSTFHLKHFCCTECDTPLAGQDYTLEEEMPYCLPCFEHSKANKCSSCERVIKPDEVGCNLNGVHFHAVDQCFACKTCDKPLMGKKMLLRNLNLYCSHVCFGADGL